MPTAPLVLLDELAEGGGVALLGGPDQLPVVARVRRSFSLAHSDALEMGKFTGSPVPRGRYQKERSGGRALSGNPRKPILV